MGDSRSSTGDDADLISPDQIQNSRPLTTTTPKLYLTLWASRSLGEAIIGVYCVVTL